MHVVHLIPELNQGGVEQVVIDLNRELVKRGHQSTVLSAGGRREETIKKEGGQHIRLDVCSKNPLTVPLRTHALKTTLSQLRPDLLHLHSRVPAWLAYFANRRLKLPTVTSVHGFNSVSRYSRIMTSGQRVICVSNPVKDYIQAHYQTPEERIRVIHCGLDTYRFDPQAVNEQDIEMLRKRLDLRHAFVATAIGRITELKDYETFIRAIAAAHAVRPDLRGLIVGHVRKDKQDYFDRLQDLITELNLKDVVHLVTDLNDMLPVYALSDVVVSCSKKPESFGLTLIEALAMNTPVVASRHGGPLDIIREGENGAFFTPQNAQELATCLQQASPPPKNLREEASNRFGLSTMIDRTLQTYEEVLTAIE